MKNMKRKKLLFILLLIVIISVGFSAISATLSITGNTGIVGNTWDVHFENVQVTTGSVAATTPAITNNDTQVSYNVTLTLPGDFYEFTVDAVNEGSIDAMIQTFSNTGLTQAQEKYLSYSIKYDNDIDVANKHLLAHGSSVTYKVRVSYRTDLDPDDLPESDQTISLTFSVTYEQADNSAIQIYNFATDSWSTIINNVRNNNTSFYHVGDTKTITMNEYGDTTIRISNMSTPAACYTTNFSQSGCGFVVEFIERVTTHVMQTENNNTPGWDGSSMRTFLNADFYNNLPSDLKTGVINTAVTTGHGLNAASNTFSTDKIFCLGTTEVFGTYDSLEDSAASLQRQLDYYAQYEVHRNNNNSYAVKTAWPWFLRTPVSTLNTYTFAVQPSGNPIQLNSAGSYGVSPAFRIG